MIALDWKKKFFITFVLESFADAAERSSTVGFGPALTRELYKFFFN